MLLAVAGASRGRSYATMNGGDSESYEDESIDYFTNSSNAQGYIDYQSCGSSDDRSGMSAIHYITLIVFPILLLQGIVGNLLAIPVLVSVSKCAWSTVVYLACLAATDLILLLIRCGSAWYIEAVGVNVSQNIMNSSDAACRTYYFSFMCVEHMNPWLVTAISVDMMIATRWPRKTYVMCTLERARYVLLLMSILIVCLDIHYFWTFGVPKLGFPCLYIEEFSEMFIDWILPTMDNTIRTFLPLTTVSACFIITAVTMIRRPSRPDTDLESEMKKYFLELSTLNDFRTICFVLCLVFVLLGIFKSTYHLITFLLSLGYIEVECLTLQLFSILDLTFTFLFYGAKIYLYIAFSPMFRGKLKRGFVRVFRRLESLSRTLCECGHKWTPVPLKDNCSTEKVRKQSQNQPLITDKDPNNSVHNVGLLNIDLPQSTNLLQVGLPQCTDSLDISLPQPTDFLHSDIPQTTDYLHSEMPQTTDLNVQCNTIGNSNVNDVRKGCRDTRGINHNDDTASSNKTLQDEDSLAIEAGTNV